MAIEAHRRDKITRNKLINLAKRVKFDDVIDEVLHCMGIKDDAEEDVHLPE